MSQTIARSAEAVSIDDFDAPASRGFVRYEIERLRNDLTREIAQIRIAVEGAYSRSLRWQVAQTLTIVASMVALAARV